MGTSMRKKHISSFQIIIFGFFMVIFIGSLILMLPWATQNGQSASFADALFTSTSAVCVTGLIVQDTATYWSEFGQFIILILIQIGGLGVVTMAVSFAVLSGRKIGLMQRSTMAEAISAHQVGGIVRLTEFILKTTFGIECLGAVIMFPVFYKEFGFIKGIWYAVFHSVSAFCNAGFDLMGIKSQFSSLTSYAGHPVINFTIMFLIIIGGIGFLTWGEMRAKKFKFKKYRLQAKVILTSTLILIIVPALFFFFYEFSLDSWKNMSLGERILGALFQSVTPRTAGFNTLDLAAFSETGQAMIICLMLIGGSPGSTAGGMKTTTAAVLVLSAAAVFAHRDSASCFGRRIADDIIKNASTILLMYLILFLTGGMVISCIEQLPILTCLFETASAIGTVGLTLGITPQLSLVSRFILIGLMFFGRVGGLNLIFAAVSGKHVYASKLPKEKITVG